MSVVDLNFASLVTPTKTTTVEYPGFPGFKLEVCFLAREEILKIRKKATTTKFDKKSRQPVEEVNDELFFSCYVEAILKGWTGLTLGYLAKLMPISLAPGQNLEDEAAYSPANAVVLMKNSADFDAFVSSVTADLEAFTASNS